MLHFLTLSSHYLVINPFPVLISLYSPITNIPQLPKTNRSPKLNQSISQISLRDSNLQKLKTHPPSPTRKLEKGLTTSNIQAKVELIWASKIKMGLEKLSRHQNTLLKRKVIAYLYSSDLLKNSTTSNGRLLCPITLTSISFTGEQKDRWAKENYCFLIRM